MEKIFIKNRKGQKVAVIVEEAKPQKGLAFVMHGFWSSKDRPTPAALSSVFFEKQYTTIRFDATNAIGESDGNPEKATVSSYYEDLEDVIRWARGEKWYEEPFCLVGSSLGGMCTALYAERHPKEIKALALLAPVISGKFHIATYSAERVKEWQEKGFIVDKAGDLIVKRGWKEMEDRLRYDLLPDAHRLIMPVIVIVGEKDTECPEKYQRMFVEKLSGKKELHVIPGMQHGSQDQAHRVEVQRVFSQWIDTL